MNENDKLIIYGCRDLAFRETVSYYFSIITNYKRDFFLILDTLITNLIYFINFRLRFYAKIMSQLTFMSLQNIKK